MAGLIDTSVISAIERRGLPPTALGEFGSGLSVAIAAITASEILFGALRANTPDRRRRRFEFIEAVLSQIMVIPFDLTVARQHALLGAALNATGSRIGANDLLIAATAIVHDRAVITHNTREFERIPGLDVRQPST